MSALRHLPRTALVAVAGVVATFIACVVVLVVTRFSPTSPVIEGVIRWWSRTWLRAAGCDLEIDGSEHVDPDRSYVIVANHMSNLDIMVSFLAIPVPIRFLAKRELFKIPVFASAMRSVGIVSVDRRSSAPMHSQINTHAKELVATGRSLIIYPEGTRSREGELGPFKKGAFTIAVGAGLPVLPVTISGTREAWPPGSPWVRGGPVRAVVDPPIETHRMTQADAVALREQVHSIIEGRLARTADQS